VTHSQSQAAIDFDGLIAGTSTYIEDALQLTTTGTFAVDDTDGRAAGSAGDAETFTLQAVDDGGFVFYSLQLGNTNASSKSVTFTATTLSGQQTQMAITVDAETGLATFSDEFLSLNQALRSLSWNMDAGVLVDTVIAVSRVEAVFTFDEIGTQHNVHEEAGYRVPSTSTLQYRSGAIRPQANQKQTITALNGSTITGTGQHAISIVVENNAVIGEGVTFDVAGTSAAVDDAGTPDDSSDDVAVAGFGGPGGGDGGGGGTGGEGGSGSSGGRGAEHGAGGGGGTRGEARVRVRVVTAASRAMMAKRGTATPAIPDLTACRVAAAITRAAEP
jgi:hypothetical protein